MNKEVVMVKTPEETERYELVKHQVEEDLANYSTYVNNMRSLRDRLLRMKEDNEIPETDIIESIVYSKNDLNSDIEFVGSDKTPLAALEYTERQKNMRDEIVHSLYIEYKAMQHKIWFIENAIAALPSDQFQIINCLVLSNWTYENTAMELAIGKKKISLLKKAAIESLVEIYQKYQPCVSI